MEVSDPYENKHGVTEGNGCPKPKTRKRDRRIIGERTKKSRKAIKKAKKEIEEKTQALNEAKITEGKLKKDIKRAEDGLAKLKIVTKTLDTEIQEAKLRHRLLKELKGTEKKELRGRPKDKELQHLKNYRDRIICLNQYHKRLPADLLSKFASYKGIETCHHISQDVWPPLIYEIIANHLDGENLLPELDGTKMVKDQYKCMEIPIGAEAILSTACTNTYP